MIVGITLPCDLTVELANVFVLKSGARREVDRRCDRSVSLTV